MFILARVSWEPVAVGSYRIFSVTLSSFNTG